MSLTRNNRIAPHVREYICQHAPEWSSREWADAIGVSDQAVRGMAKRYGFTTLVGEQTTLRVSEAKRQQQRARVKELRGVLEALPVPAPQPRRRRTRKACSGTVIRSDEPVTPMALEWARRAWA